MSVVFLEKQKVLSDIIEFIPKENVKLDEPMSKHTSFKTGGNAEIFVLVNTENQIRRLLNYSKQNSIDLYVIGNGSNLLVSDKGIKGIVAKISFEDLVITENDKDIIVEAGAGIKVMALAQLLKSKGISDFEELSGFPGTIGGANYMNAGAYGKEMKDVIIETKALNKETGNIEILKNEEQELKYRSSIFKNKKYIILQTKLRLKKGNTEEIEKKMYKFRMKECIGLDFWNQYLRGKNVSSQEHCRIDNGFLG